MSPFIWSVKVSGHQFHETVAAGKNLCAETMASQPQAAYVLVTSRLGILLLDAQGDALDLEELPYELAAKLAAFLAPAAMNCSTSKWSGPMNHGR